MKKVIASYIEGKLAENIQGGFIHLTPVQGPTEEEIENVAVAAVARVYVFQPTSAMGLLSTVKGLTTYLSQPENHSLSIGLICLDALTAFHHVVRATDKQSEYYATLSTSLRSLSSLFAVPVITTSWALFAKQVAQNQGRQYVGTGPSHSHSVSVQRPVWRQYFPGEWLCGVDCRIILQKREVRGFMAGMSLVEAEMEKERRMEVVKRGAVLGWLENDEGKEFEMSITDEGVKISP